MYASINVLEAMLNDIASKRMIIAAMTLGHGMEITAAFSMIRLHGVVPFPGFLAFPISFIICGTGLFIFTNVCASLCVQSGKLISYWKRSFSVTKYHTRRLRSLRPIRVKCGQNFIDRTT